MNEIVPAALRRSCPRIRGIACAVALLGGCVPIYRTAVLPPSEDGPGGHLVSRQIDDHTWRVYWDGDQSFIDGVTQEDFFLYRVAALSVEKGFDWFSVTGQHVQMFTGTAPPDVLGTYDARQLMKYVGPHILPKASPAG
jgi:hypothetical protein